MRVEVVLVESNGNKLATFPSTAKPSTFSDQTSRGKSEEFYCFAFVRFGVEALDMVAAIATWEVDNVLFLGAYERPQLPMPITIVLGMNRNVKEQMKRRTASELECDSACGPFARRALRWDVCCYTVSPTIRQPP